MPSALSIRLAVFMTCIIAAAIYLAPSHREIALMQMHDADYTDAMQHYHDLYKQGDRSINVLIPLISLYEHYGDIDKAITVLEAFVTANPRSAEGYRRLAGLYKASQRFNRYAGALEALQTLAPSTDTLRTLADTYDFLGRYPEETRALARLTARKDYRPREEDYVKLASYYRINGQYAEASQTMVDLLAAKGSEVSVETVYLAAHLLLDNGEEKQSFAAAQSYLDHTKREKDAIMLSSLFRRQSRLDSAYALLAPYLSNIEQSPELLEQVVTLQMMRGKEKYAYDLLSKQFARNALPETLTVTLVDLGVKYNDYALVEGLINNMKLDNAPQDALLRYADMAYQRNRPDLAQAMQKRLGKDYLKDTPLLAAVLDVAAHDTPQAVQALLAVPPKEAALPEQKVILANMLMRHGHAQRAAELVNSVSIADAINTFDPQQLAQLYLDTNQAEQGLARLLSARPASSPAVEAKMQKAELLLAAGAGKSEQVFAWLSERPDTATLLPDAFTLAGYYKHDALAAQLADRIYKSDRSPENRLQLADALIADRRYPEALQYLQAPAQKDPQARALYLDAMSGWIRQAGIRGISDSNRATLNNYISALLKRGDISLQEKRNLAYLLKETGFTDKAGAIFLELAGSQPYGTSDVNELLGFWGEHLSPGALSWVENRARSSEGAEKALWLEHLNNTGNPQSTIAILHGTSGLSGRTLDAYVDALTVTKSKKQLAQVLSHQFAQEGNIKRVSYFATIARQEDMPEVAEAGWQRVHELDPENSEAAKELGLLAFAANRYSEAKPLLEQYLKSNPASNGGDYRVNYAYAEILQHKSKESQAKPFYAEAQAQLEENPQKDIASLSDKAHLLYRNNRLEEALDLYRQLLASHPENKNVRADFAEMLIEARRYDEASSVLE